ncbi:hypothetical protein [Alloalcanivorax mobilis]|uniref:hypothetical protein n=1 Tax=Alloalcanivorax mobilis TaxID=2019569 RepID=UPI000C7597DC|nr:hypothetical protein [Alloalcanivorax mobilis]
MNASELAQALKQAHVSHACQRLQEKSYWQTQLTDGVHILGKQPLGGLVNAEVIAGVVDEWLANLNTTTALEPVIIDVSEAVLRCAEDDDTRVGELLSEAHFEALLEQGLRLQKLRERVIHACLNHPLVSEMVSEMLYTGIKNFLLEENALAKLPGVSSMMKLGRKSVGKAMGGLEESIRVYLRHNIRATLKTGEQWLNRQLTNERIAELSRDGYRRLATMRPADAIKLAPAGLAKDITPHACAIADEATHLQYSRQLVAAGIHAAVQSLTQWTLPALLKAMGTTSKARIKVLAPALASGAAQLHQQNILAPLVEQALGDFYDSDACMGVLEGALEG